MKLKASHYFRQSGVFAGALPAVLTVALCALLFAPILILLGRLISSETYVLRSPFTGELVRVLFNSTCQALLSAAGSLIFGFLGAFGLLSLSSRFSPRWRMVAQVFVMLPGLLPTLFVIVAGFHLVSFFGPFPFGIPGVVLIHVFMNAGLMAVAIARLIENQLGGMIELATVEGASRWALLKAISHEFWGDLMALGFLVFTLAFSSYSVPLVVGADQGATLEVMIYRTIMGQGDLSMAVSLSIVQLTLILLFSFLIVKPAPSALHGARNFSKVASPVTLWGLVIFTAILLFSSFAGVSEGFQQLVERWQTTPDAQIAFWVSFLGTCVQCLTVAGLSILFFFALTYLLPQRFLHQFFIGYTAPSVVITGLAFYLLFDLREMSLISACVVLALAFALVTWPSLYRLRGASLFSALEGQIHIARTMGASRHMVAVDIVWPQIRRDIFFLAGIAAIWASGDFALSSIIAGQESTLGVLAKSLLGRYRVEQATVVTWVSLGVGGIVFLICEGLGRVGYSSSRT